MGTPEPLSVPDPHPMGGGSGARREGGTLCGGAALSCIGCQARSGSSGSSVAATLSRRRPSRVHPTITKPMAMILADW
jgi:hypothetical protein